MRIRKNWTSSRETPEYFLTQASALEELELRKRAAAAAAALAKIDPPPVVVLEPSVPAKKLKTHQQTLSIEVDAAAILSSLDNESPSYDREIKIRDSFLAHGGNARSGGSENHASAIRSRQSGSESYTAHATGSRKRKITEQQHVYNGDEPKSSSTLSEKMNCDSSSTEIESVHEHAFAKSEVIDDHLLPKPTTVTTTTAVVNTERVVGSRKMVRRPVEFDSSLVQKDIGSTKSEEEDHKYAAAARREKESLQTPPPASRFPEGWSYRGLAVIAERDKANEGQQCARRDGRSWRCPLKVQEGFALCQHHLNKLRLKKLKNGVKKHQPSAKQPQQQQQLQKQQTPASPPSTTPPQIGISSLERQQVRRRFKNVKL